MELTIDKYSDKNKGDFEKIWVDWLSNSMGIKPQQIDVDEVRNPLDNYINTGGMAFSQIKMTSVSELLRLKN